MHLASSHGRREYVHGCVQGPYSARIGCLQTSSFGSLTTLVFDFQKKGAHFWKVWLWGNGHRCTECRFFSSFNFIQFEYLSSDGETKCTIETDFVLIHSSLQLQPHSLQCITQALEASCIVGEIRNPDWALPAGSLQPLWVMNITSGLPGLRSSAVWHGKDEADSVGM